MSVCVSEEIVDIVNVVTDQTVDVVGSVARETVDVDISFVELEMC